MAIESNIIRNNPTAPSNPGNVNVGRNTGSAVGSGTMSMHSSLAEGQVLKGEITDIRGKNVTISLSDKSTITAQVKDISNLYIGQTTAFRVTAVSPRFIALESLLQDISNQENLAVRKALDAADLPPTERNVNIVQELLQNRMPINKETIMNMIKQYSALDDVSVKTVVLMNKYNIPTTQPMASQFEMYSTGESSLLQDIDVVSEELPALLEELSANAEATPVATFGGRLMSILSEHIESNPKPILSADVAMLSAPERNELVRYINEAAAALPAEAVDTEQLTTITAAITNGTASVTDVKEYMQQLDNMIKQLRPEGNSETLEGSETSVTQGGAEDPASVTAVTGTEVGALSGESGLPSLPPAYSKVAASSEYIEFNNNSLSSFMEPEMRESLAESLKELVPSNKLLQDVVKGNISAEEVFTAINENIHNSPKAAASLFASKPFTELFRTVIRDSWTLTERELKSTDNITDYYRQLADQLMKTTELIKANLSGTASQNLTSQTSQMSDSLGFMNELNNMFQFIQLPIKFQDQTVRSDLYVYTKKEELRRHPDKISVLLRLDMEHLGHLDINITKEKGRIDSSFTCSDQSAVDLLAKNMDMLRETMASNGYIFSARVSKEQNTASKNPMQLLLEQSGSPDGRIPAAGNTVNRYAFDLRA